jgi:hypothetical protein
MTDLTGSDEAAAADVAGWLPAADAMVCIAFAEAPCCSASVVRVARTRRGPGPTFLLRSVSGRR